MRQIAFARLFGVAVVLGALALSVPAQTLDIPPRPSGALTGSQIVAQITGLSLTAREQRIYDEVAAGNIPDFYRTLRPVTVTGFVGGQNRTAIYHVIPDYLALGSDADYFLCPMTPTLAQQIANLLRCNLPTRKMVNDIWSAAEVKLAPQPIPPSPEMTTVPVFDQHNTMVWQQRQTYLAAHPLGALVGGDKKDIVITPQLFDGSRPPPPRVAIYGWHYQNGTPIQPLSLVHENTYADYSHGVRLVQSAMTVDGQSTTADAVLGDPNLAGLLSDEGAFTTTRYPTPAPPEDFPYADAFPASGRQLASWQDRFTTPAIIAFSPTSPGGDGYVLRVQDPSGGIETTRLGRLMDADYFVECDIFCEYRPSLAADGFERLGIFARDDGNGVFEGISGSGIRGNSYALTWDSGDGRVHCFNTVEGVPTDLLPAPVTEPSTAWRHFRIEALGSQITFKLDGVVLASVVDTAHPAGQFGIGYHEYFATNSNIAGTRADNFRADVMTSAPAAMSGLVLN
jgi:hypothetical protein